jgi:hypothetical protein
MNVPTSQVVFRAPYLYCARRSSAIRIGHTLRPGYEAQRLQTRYGAVEWLCCIRAFAILAPILWQRFAYCAVGGQWFTAERRLLLLVDQLNARDPDQLLSVDALRNVFAVVFPDSPFVGVADYRLSETCISRSRYKYALRPPRLGK